MSIRESVSGRQVLAVSLALIMLVSMGGMAFVGGAGAQTAGGTYDSAVDSTDVGNDVNIANDSAVKTVGASTTLEDDGSVTLASSADTNFAGVAVTPDRIDTLFDVGESFEDDPAAFLDAAPGTLSVSDSATDASGAVFIEFDPQSEFSQIDTTVTGENDVAGTHDYIVVTTGSEAAALTGTATESTPGAGDGTLASDKTTSPDDIVAISVDNSNPSDYSLLADAGTGTHGDALDSLVGTQENTLQDKNVDDALFAAGTFGASTSTITAFDVGDGTNSRLVHSEQVTLEPGDGSQDQYYTSVESAIGDATADQGDTIRVTGGTYNGNGNTNDASFTADVASLTIVGEENPFTGSVPSFEEKTTVSAANVTIDGITFENTATSASEAVLIDTGGDDPTVLNSTVIASVNAGVSGNAITVAPDVAGEVTIENNDLNAADTTTVGSADIGLNLQAPDSATVVNNNFAGFETQINNAGANVNATVLRDNNTFAQLAVPVDANNNVVSVDGDIYGSINAADADGGAAGNTIAVGSGTYNEGGVTISTDNVVVSGDADTRPTIGGNVDLASNTEVTFENFVVGGTFTDSGTASDLTVRSVDLDGQSLTVDAADSVTLEDLSLTTVGASDAITIGNGAGAGDVLVNDVDITGISNGNTGVLVQDGSDNVNVTDVTVTATDGATAVNGITINGIDNAATAANEYTVDNATLTNLGDGVGINLQVGTQGSNGIISITDNTVRGGQMLTGVQYNLPRAEDVTITGNTLVGADVAGGSSSVGVEFEAITGFGSDPFTGSGDDAIPFNNNTITGHAYLIAETDTQADSVISEAGYDAILDPENNNEFGTLVIGPDGTSYEDTYGTVDNLDVTGANSYLPGSIDEAANLVDAAANVNSAELEVKDPDGLEGVDSYDDARVDFPETDGISITGENKDVLVKTTFLITDNNADLNNNNISNLTIEAESADAVIKVASANAQSSFSDLNVTNAGSGSGFLVSSTTTDVNVVTVTDSTFDVNGDGLVLEASGGDDRDGFTVENVSVTGPGIDTASTGLDLSSVDKPGKEGIEQLNVTEVDLDGFQTQVQLSQSLVDSGINAEGVYNGVTAGPIEFSQNTFEQAVLVYAEDSGTESLADDDTLYGSIDFADSAGVVDTDTANDAAIVDVVEAGDYNEDVTIGEAGVAGDTDLLVRGLTDDEVTINGNVDLATTNHYDSITLTDVTVVGQTDTGTSVIDLSGVTANVDIISTDVTSDDDSEYPDAISVGGLTGDLTLDDVAVVDGTTATSVDLTNAAVTSVDIKNSVFTNGDYTDGDSLGVNIAADVGTVDITNTEIRNHEDAGISTSGAAATVDVSNSTLTDNLKGIDASTGGTFTLDVNEETLIDNNDEEGILVNSGTITLSVTDATISNHDAGDGVAINAAATDSEITQTTFESNDISLGVDAIAGDLTVQNNAFNSGTTAIENNDVELNATLNYYGERAGPGATTTPNITGTATTVYDPFLTTNQTSADDVSSTTEFGHDVVVSSGSVTTVGFPAQVEDGLTLADVFDTELEGAVYELKADGTFGLVDEDFENHEVEAFDAYVVDNTDSVDSSVLIEYDSDGNNTNIARNEFNEGLNFVPATRAGTVDDSLFPGGDTDYVAQPFELGDNLYGVGAQTDADLVRDPTAAGFGENFRSGAGDKIVHPHAGYLVIVNEESNVGLTVAEQITKPATVTAANVADRTDNTDTIGTDAFLDTTITGTTAPVAAGADSFDVTVDVENLGDKDDIQTLTIEEVSTSGSAATIDLPQDENLRVNAGQTQTVTFTVNTDGGETTGDTITVEVSTEDSSATETVVVA
ncbi:hypothetical protein [Halorubrum sp. N11]|uniref:beta strand repeat-containing protein n=1 Tax=Halorubrum sp. N11 TaxID=3402276 RepID=UPI003EBC68C3